VGVRHVFVDESKKGPYRLIAASTSSADLRQLRRSVTGLVRPGQRRLHMVKESPARRRLILDRLQEAGFTATIYEAGGGHRTDVARRRACLSTLAAEAAVVAPVHLVIESAAGVDQRDKQHLIEVSRGLPDRAHLTYQHAAASQELLLAAPDAIGWAWARGGDWRAQARPLVTSVVAV